MNEYLVEKLKEFLSGLAIIITIIIGINYFSHGPLLALIIFLVIILIFILIFILNSPKVPIRILQDEWIIDIRNKEGKEASFVRTITLKTLRKHTNHMIATFAADGTVALNDFKVNRGYIDKVKIRLLSGLYYVPFVFDHIPKKLVESYTFTINGIFLNSYTKDHEYFAKIINYYTDKFILKVKFPQDRRCISREGVKVFGAEILKEDIQPKRETEGGCDFLIWEINKPKFMYNYVLEWVW